MTRPISTARGIATMTLGYLLLGVQPVFVKLATAHGLTSGQTVALRFVLALLLVLAVAHTSGQSLRTAQPGVWTLRGVLGGAAVLLYFESVRLVGAGLGTLLNYTYPIWANLLSLTIGERPSRTIWLALPLAILGTVLVVDPTGPTGIGRGELCGLISGVLSGAAIVCIKRLRRTDGELTIIASFSLVGLALSLPALSWTSAGSMASGSATSGVAQNALTQVEPVAWLHALVVGLFSFYGHVYFTRGYKETTIQLGTVLSLLVPALAAALGAAFLGERLAPEALVGGGFIGAGVLLIAVRERLAQRGRRAAD